MDDVSIHFKKIPIWKVPGLHESHECWLEKITSPHQAMLKHLNDCIQTRDVPKWMEESRTALIKKR